MTNVQGRRLFVFCTSYIVRRLSSVSHSLFVIRHSSLSAPATRTRRTLFDRHVHQVAPLGPGAVVVANPGVAEQVLEHEPGVRRALTDAAVGNHVFVGGDALTFVDAAQLFRALEGAVFADRGGPRDVA